MNSFLSQNLEALSFAEGLLSQARKQLNLRSKKDKELFEISTQLRAESSGRLICPFCLYQSEKNKTSAVVKNGIFKCFACGKFGRLEQ